MMTDRMRKVRLAGGFVLVGLIGFGAGNFHKTKEALAGEGRWWEQYCHQKLVDHEKADVAKYGW